MAHCICTELSRCQQVKSPSVDPDPELWVQASDDVPLEEQLQDLAIGAQEDGVSQGSPELMEDVQPVEEPEAFSSSGLSSLPTIFSCLLPTYQVHLRGPPHQKIRSWPSLQMSSSTSPLRGRNWLEALLLSLLQSLEGYSLRAHGHSHQGGSHLWLLVLASQRPSLGALKGSSRMSLQFTGRAGQFLKVFMMVCLSPTHRCLIWNPSLNVESASGPSRVHEADMVSETAPATPEAEVNSGPSRSISLGGLELAYPTSRSASASLHTTSLPPIHTPSPELSGDAIEQSSGPEVLETDLSIMSPRVPSSEPQTESQGSRKKDTPALSPVQVYHLLPCCVGHASDFSSLRN